MAWHMIAYRVTHTSVAMTRLLIGHSEFIDWLAFFELMAEEEKKAIEKARNNSR